MDKNPIKVLLVDDDENDYILILNWVREFQVAQCGLTWVDNYIDAREAIASGQHDIYLVDYNLAIHDGWQLLHEILASDGTSPIILLLGNGNWEIDSETIKTLTADYLEKSQLTAPLLERSIQYTMERKQSAQKIRQQAALLDMATDAIFVCDLNQQILYWNQAAESLYGWKSEEAVTKKTQELWEEKNLSQFSVVLDILLKVGSWQGELNQKTRFGKDIIVESRWTLMNDFSQNVKSILVVNSDITDKKQLESKFLRVQRLESIGTLASGIAHDLNNVLSPILMTAQLLESQIHDEYARRLIPILITNAKRGANLVKQVLSFTRGIQGERSLLQLKHLIIEIQHIIKETFPKSIEVLIQIPQDFWTIYGDATQLHQVLMNLCVNARDAMPNGGILQISAENLLVDENYARMHTDAKLGAYVVVSVIDTGTGIKPAILERIFEPFFTTKELEEGTGLGLSTVLGIIKNHGGFINVYTEEGKGTQFKVYLPAQEVKETREESEIHLSKGNGELVLVVDDEPAIRELTKTSLERFNYQAITASNGIEAVAMYVEKSQEISLVLTDIIMPCMDGLTTIRTLQKINPQVKIIAVSGLASADKVNTVYDLGVKAFLCKPYTTNQLLQTIHAVNESKS